MNLPLKSLVCFFVLLFILFKWEETFFLDESYESYPFYFTRINKLK